MAEIFNIGQQDKYKQTTRPNLFDTLNAKLRSRDQNQVDDAIITPEKKLKRERLNNSWIVRYGSGAELTDDEELKIQQEVIETDDDFETDIASRSSIKSRYDFIVYINVHLFLNYFCSDLYLLKL